MPILQILQRFSLWRMRSPYELPSRMSHMAPANNVSLLLSGAQLAPSRESFFEQFDLPPGSDLVAQMQARPRSIKLFQAGSCFRFHLLAAAATMYLMRFCVIYWTASEQPCC